MPFVLGPEHPFHGSRAKIDRAKEHTNTLDAEFAVFIEGHPHGLIVETTHDVVDAETGEYIAGFELGVTPPRWGAVLGEIVHDLRSGLNHLITSTAEEVTDKSQFPMANTTTDYKSCWQMVATVPEEFLAIIEAVQPYKRGDIAAAINHPLARVAELTNRDKHHALLTTLLGFEGAKGHFHSVWEHPGIEGVEFTVGPSKEETSIERVRFRPRGEGGMNVDSNETLAVAFEDLMLSVHRMAVLPIIREMVDCADSIVTDFFAAAT